MADVLHDPAYERCLSTRSFMLTTFRAGNGRRMRAPTLRNIFSATNQQPMVRDGEKRRLRRRGAKKRNNNTPSLRTVLRVGDDVERSMLALVDSFCFVRVESDVSDVEGSSRTRLLGRARVFSSRSCSERKFRRTNERFSDGMDSCANDDHDPITAALSVSPSPFSTCSTVRRREEYSRNALAPLFSKDEGDDDDDNQDYSFCACENK